MADMGTDAAQMATELLKGLIRIGTMASERALNMAFRYGPSLVKGCAKLGVKGAKAIAHSPGAILDKTVNKEKNVLLHYESVEQAAINRAAMLDRFDFKPEDIEQIGKSLVVKDKKLFEKQVNTPEGRIEMMRGMDALAKDKDRYNQIVKEAEGEYEDFQKDCIEAAEKGEAERDKSEPDLEKENPYVDIDRNDKKADKDVDKDVGSKDKNKDGQNRAETDKTKEEVRENNKGPVDKVDFNKGKETINRENPYANVKRNSKGEKKQSKSTKSVTREHDDRNAIAAKAKDVKSADAKSHSTPSKDVR